MCDKCCGEVKTCCVPCQPCQPCCPVMDDCLAQKIACIWKAAFCDAIILPKVGVPSCACGVMTLKHSLGKCIPTVKINGLCVKSMLANNSFYSAEVSGGKWVNLYQGLIPNVAGKCGCKSSSEVYVETLIKFGISVDSINQVWKGSCPELITVSSKAVGMEPCEFSQKQVAAVKAVIDHFLNPCC